MPYVVPDSVKEPLYAIVPYFNPWRWKSREKHTLRAIKHFADAGAVVVLVEAAFNRRSFSLADCGLDGAIADCSVHGPGYRHQYIGLRTKDELWLKENLINLAVARLPHNWEQVCWLDSDVHFVRPNWVGECIHKLQHYAFLQMFSHARDMGPNYELLPENYPHADGRGFVAAFQDGVLGDFGFTKKQQPQPEHHRHHHPPHHHPPKPPTPPPYSGANYAGRVFPGLAWAATRKAWDDVGGLIDFAVWGGADYHMAHALIEKTEGMMRNDLHRNYRKLVMQWYYRCHTHIRRNVGCMEGTILHSWHGRKTERGYNAKHHLLAEIGFDPLRHLKRDFQGLYELHDDRSTAYVRLRDMMRKIAKERDEDSDDTRLDLFEREQGH